jgi:hypothetical protein
MLLVLGDVAGIETGDLMARVSKITGEPGVRGPMVDVRGEKGSRPLSALRTGDKLHVLAPSNGIELAGIGPDGLVDVLVRLGWSQSTRLKQIHLIAPSAGRNGRSSFAGLFEAAIRSRGYQVDEIKAPVGPVRCDAHGKMWVFLETAHDWAPSSAALNYYVGPRVPEKHR